MLDCRQKHSASVAIVTDDMVLDIAGIVTSSVLEIPTPDVEVLGEILSITQGAFPSPHLDQTLK